jgi:hypothetical protein
MIILQQKQQQQQQQKESKNSKLNYDWSLKTWNKKLNFYILWSYFKYTLTIKSHYSCCFQVYFIKQK